MSEMQLACAAMPLNAESSVYALVAGSREGMKSLLGSRSENLQRRIDPLEWAVKPEVCCLIGDEGADVSIQEDDRENPQTLPGLAVKLLYLRYQAHMSGWTLLPCVSLPHNAAHLQEAMIACSLHWKLPAAFLQWLVTENTFASTMTDCAEWLIETDKSLPVPEIAEAVRYVRDLQPYALRKQWMLGGAGVITAAVGALCGMNTIGAIMRDGDFRSLLGKALTEEIMPGLKISREEGLQYAARVCAYLENACGEEAWPAIGENLLARFVACVLPALAAYEKQNAALPSCLCFALSSLIMLYAGVRKNAEGEYRLPTEKGDAPVLEQEYALAAFSRMSCDMPPESLAYAALSDYEIWGCDLREIDGLEDKVTDQLRDMQLLGAKSALLRAAGL